MVSAHRRGGARTLMPVAKFVAALGDEKYWADGVSQNGKCADTGHPRAPGR